MANQTFTHANTYSAIYRVTTSAEIICSELRLSSDRQSDQYLRIESGHLWPQDDSLKSHWLSTLGAVYTNQSPSFFASPGNCSELLAAVVPCMYPSVVEVRTQQRRVCSVESLTAFARIAGLTRREFEIADLLSTGLVPKQIASRFDTGVSTVRTQIRSILFKCQVNSVGNLLFLFSTLPAVEVTCELAPDHHIRHQDSSVFVPLETAVAAELRT